MYEIILLIIAYIAATALLGYILYDISRSSLRRRFREDVSEFIEKNIDENTTVNLIYESAYQYKQPPDSIKAAITSHLSKSASTIDNNKSQKILKIINQASELSSILSLPDEVVSSAKEILANHPESKKDLIIISSYVRTAAINLANRDIFYQKIRLATALTSTVLFLFKSKGNVIEFFKNIPGI